MNRKLVTGLLALTFVLGGAALPDMGGCDTAIEASAEVIDSGKCGEYVNWKLENNGTLTISGKGKMTNYSYMNSPFFWKINIYKIIIKNGVTSIGSNAFKDASDLKEISIPDSVTTIEASAVERCGNLYSITLPNSVKYVGPYAFSGCSNVARLKLSNKLTTISENAFYGLNITTLTIPEGVEKIESNAFGGAKNLTAVTIAESVNSIAVDSFSSCSKLKKIIGKKGSYAEDFAFVKGLEFVDIDNLPGNVNNDSKIDIEDAVLVINHVNGLRKLSKSEFNRADVDGNGNVDIEDAVAIINHVNGISVIV